MLHYCNQSLEKAQVIDHEKVTGIAAVGQAGPDGKRWTFFAVTLDFE